VNTRDLRNYIRTALAGDSPTQQAEQLPPAERAQETMAVQLRRSEGIERAAFQRQTGHEVDQLAGPAVARLVELGLLDDNGRRVCLTRRGKYVADAVVEQLLR
jgi:oxygen-independent coproporphyrinogen-3 oxidase